MLAGQFGDEYLQYKERTGGIIPKFSRNGK